MRRFIQAIAVIVILAVQGHYFSVLAEEEWTLTSDEIAIFETNYVEQASHISVESIDLYLTACAQQSSCNPAIVYDASNASLAFSARNSGTFSVPFAEDGFDPMAAKAC